MLFYLYTTRSFVGSLTHSCIHRILYILVLNRRSFFLCTRTQSVVLRHACDYIVLQSSLLLVIHRRWAIGVIVFGVSEYNRIRQKEKRQEKKIRCEWNMRAHPNTYTVTANGTKQRYWGSVYKEAKPAVKTICHTNTHFMFLTFSLLQLVRLFGCPCAISSYTKSQATATQGAHSHFHIFLSKMFLFYFGMFYQWIIFYEIYVHRYIHFILTHTQQQSQRSILFFISILCLDMQWIDFSTCTSILYRP